MLFIAVPVWQQWALKRIDIGLYNVNAVQYLFA